MDISITIHAEPTTLNFDVLACDFFVPDGEIGCGRAGMIVNDTWNNRSQNVGKWAEKRNRKDVAVFDSETPFADHLGLFLHPGIELILAAKDAL